MKLLLRGEQGGKSRVIVRWCAPHGASPFRFRLSRNPSLLFITLYDVILRRCIKAPYDAHTAPRGGPAGP